MKPWERIHDEHLGSYKVFDLRRARRRSPRTGSDLDFMVLEAPDWVNILPLTPQGELVLVRQYRHGPDRFTLEIPGGCLAKAGEDPAEAALRELAEETGYAASELFWLGKTNPNPALFTNACHTFLAAGCTQAGAPAPDPGEDLEVVVVSEAEADRLAMDDAIDHALVLAAFYWRRLHREGLLAGRRAR